MNIFTSIESQNDPIQIVFCIDKNYIQHCAVTITSIFSNTTTNNISISIIYSNIDDKSKSKLDSYIKGFTSDVKFILINEKDLKRFPVSDHITLASYYRIFLADLLESDIKKVVFLDCDLIVKKDIIQLWNIDISNYSHAAAIDHGVDNAHKESLGIPNNADYFNAGVMLINLEYWRNNEVSKKSIKFIQNKFNKIKFWDQDVLNFVLQSQYLVVDSTWNATGILFRSDIWESLGFSKIKCQELLEFSLDPAIIHFTGTYKPWHSDSDHPLKQEYYKYLTKTPWQNFVPTRKPSLLIRIRTKIKKTILRLRQKLHDLME